MATYRIEIPDWLPASTNELLGHWRRTGRRKRTDREVIGGYWFASGYPEAVGKRRVSLVLTQVAGRPRDPDNALKSTLDALAHARALWDDGPRSVELGSVEIRYGPRRQLEITLEDIEP